MPPERMKGGIHAAGTKRADAEQGEPGLGVSGHPLWGGAQHGTGGGDAESLHRTVPGPVYPGGPGPGGEKGDTGAQGPKGDTGAQGPQNEVSTSNVTAFIVDYSLNYETVELLMK